MLLDQRDQLFACICNPLIRGVAKSLPALPLSCVVLFFDVVALNEYRNKMGIDAKMVLMTMASSRSTIGDPNDKRVLDLVGLDNAAPSLISQFVLGNV